MNKIPVVLASDNKLFFAVATVLVSMTENAKKDTFYEIYILCSGDVTQKNKQRIKEIEGKYNNISITFIDMKNTFANIKKTHKYVTHVSAYKMKIPSLTKKYNKVIYLDSDVIVRDDLSELYATDMGCNYITGVPSIINQTLCRDMVKDIIKIDMDNYINAGVLLFNNKEILKDNIDEKCIALLGKFEGSVDQHIFNYICHRRIGFLPFKYNVFLSDYELYEQVGNIFTSTYEIISAKQNPVIMHFTKKEKPWDYYDLPFAHEWFRYYSKTGFPPRERMKLPISNTIRRFYIFDVPILKIIEKGNTTKYYLLGIKVATLKRK